MNETTYTIHNDETMPYTWIVTDSNGDIFGFMSEDDATIWIERQEVAK